MNNFKKIIFVLVVILFGIGVFKVAAYYTYKSITFNGDAALNAPKSNFKKDIILANKENPLEENYIPKNLAVPNVEFMNTSNKSVRSLDLEAGINLENMFNDAKKQGVDFLAVSGYRSYNYQKNLYNKKVRNSGKIEADKYVAKPGYSEHQTGLAIDILSRDYVSLDEGFENTNAYKWLKKNCNKYGFIIRYPKGKEKITGYSYEPWHIRYVGKEVATEIHENNITLEEYIKK